MLDSVPEGQRGDPPVRASEPTPDRSAVHREGVPKHDPMGGKPGSIRPPLGDDDPRRHGQRVPAPIRHDLQGQSTPLVHPTDELVDIDDVGLELDDHERPMARMPSEDVDDPAFSVDRERHLGIEGPGGKLLGEPSCHRLVQACMTAANQAIEVCAAGSSSQGDLDIEDTSDRQDRRELHAVDMAPLDPGDDGGIAAGSPRHVELAPPPTNPDRPKPRPKLLHRIHAASLTWGGYPAGTGGLFGHRRRLIRGCAPCHG